MAGVQYLNGRDAYHDGTPTQHGGNDADSDARPGPTGFSLFVQNGAYAVNPAQFGSRAADISPNAS
jgi:hypothetical protein